MDEGVIFIGFGEAGRALAKPGARAFDLRLNDMEMREAMTSRGVVACADRDTALASARVVLSLVTADQALSAAQSAAASIAPGTLWLDMNSVAPDTKRAAAVAIEAAGGRYVDVAVMAPVHPKRHAVPLLVSGPHGADAADWLRSAGFTDIGVAGDAVGAASAVKMIRSVMVKGMEALSAECALAASAAGVLDQVVASLDASDTRTDWRTRVDYNLDRMMLHGRRRAAEMVEVVATLDALGTGSVMSRATTERQHAIGEQAILPPDGLAAKLAMLSPARLQDRAA